MSTHDDFRTDKQMEENRKYWTEGPGSKKPGEHEEGGVMVPDTEEADPEDADEETGLSALVGTPGLSAHTHSVVSGTSGGLGGLGSGIHTSPPFAPTPSYPVYPGTTTPGWGTTTTTTGPVSPVKRKTVRLPPEFTDKVLLAFVDPDIDEDEPESVTWAAHLLPLHFEMVKDEDGRVTLEITFSLEDVYENNDK